MCDFEREEKNLKKSNKRRDKQSKKNRKNKVFSRNELCSCGSTLKFKDCCGRE